jgi:alkanesulfonate monooxygenase SsuD/methylene tetrahydromethanopterin reductase-like flavin-dependent oxidoreductase (luciferase family)
MRVAPKITVTNEQRKTLESWARGRSTAVRLMQRAQIVLRAADGQQNQQIAAELELDPGLVGRWRSRFAASGLAGIEKDAIRNDALMQAAGLTAAEAEPIARAKSEQGVESATRMVTDEIMDKVVIAGNPAEVTDKLKALAAEGLTMPLLYQIIGPDRVEAVRLVARDVKPAFEAV